jgi:multidrug resistance protein, MATE family
MRKTSTTRLLLGLAWPIVLARATQAVVGFTDALMVAPLGEDALAAVTTGALNTLALVMLPMGTVFIVQTFAAQLRGKGELESVRRYAWYGLVIALASGIITVLAVPFVPTYVGMFGYTPGVSDAMSSFIAIRLLGVGAIVAMEALGNWYGGLGNTRLAMFAGVITMTANVAGNYLLIEPRFGLPGFGVEGAAWASTAASWLGFAAIALAFARGWGGDVRKGTLELRRSELWRVIRFGLPNGINWFLEFAAFVLFINVVVAHLGTTALAAMNVVFQINSISFMPAFGVASAGAILAGEAIGAGRLDRVWPAVRLTLGVTMTWMASVGVLYFVCSDDLLALFRPPDEAADSLLALGSLMLKLAAFWQLFDAVAMTFSEALRAAGDTAWCLRARVAIAWFVFTPVAWGAVLLLGAGVVTMMACLIGYMVLLAAVFAWRFGSGRWREIQLLEASASTTSPTSASA